MLNEGGVFIWVRAMLGRRVVCKGVRRKSTLSIGFRVERKATVVKKYIREEEEECEDDDEGTEGFRSRGDKGKDDGRRIESGKEEEEDAGDGDDDDWEGNDEEQASPLYASTTTNFERTDLFDVKRGSLFSSSRVVLESTRTSRAADDSILLREVRRRIGSFQAHEEPEEEDTSPPEYKDLVKIVMLGAPSVGKTSIIQQYVWNEFWDQYYPTDRRQTYYPSVVINGRLYGLKISDLPPVPYFPVDSLYEWTDFRSYGLRTATAYVLVFDLSNAEETFHYIKCIREQMSGSRDMKNVPVVVVGNKHDRLRGRTLLNLPVDLQAPSVSHRHSYSLLGAPQSPALGLAGMSRSVSNLNSGHPTGGPSRGNSLLSRQAHQNSFAFAEAQERRDIAHIVQKHWRCGYVECSAKYNWRVVSVFKELMQAVDTLEGNGGLQNGGGNAHISNQGEERDNDKETFTSFHRQRHHCTSIVPDNLYPQIERNKCTLL